MPLHRSRSDACIDCATRSICLLGRVPLDELPALQGFVNKRTAQPGEVISTEGTVATVATVVKVGNVFGYRRGLDGRDRPIGMAGRGAVFGLFGYYGEPSQATGVAASASRICEIPMPTLRTVVSRHPAMLKELVQASIQVCGAIAVWSEAMRVPGITNQLAYAVVLLADAQRNAVIELPTHSALAKLLATTRETIARAFATLEAEGSLQRLERKKCEVRREALLARVQAAGGMP